MKEYLNTVDDPFDTEIEAEEAVFPLSQKRRQSTALQCVVPCPRGEELVDPDWLEEETVVYTRQQLEDLLLKETLLANLHARPTLKSMQAVVPPSSWPAPESLVSVLEKL